jgi:hypothetical protein
MALLFRFFVATGMKIGDKIVHFRLSQDIPEGWHLMTTMKYLCTYLVFA